METTPDSSAHTEPSSADTDADGYESEELTDEELIARAQECFRIGRDSLSYWRGQAVEDLQFLAGEQWDANIKAQRDNQKRPALTINRLPQFVQQVTNEQRQSKPSITVSPVDSDGDKRVADVLQGVIRNVEYTSNADAAYAAGGQAAARTGLGYWDVAAEYEDELSFKQKLSIRRIKNSLAVTMDPGAKEVAGDDSRWVLISTDISGAEWKATYPDREIPRGDAMGSGGGDAAPDWVSKDGARIHEYRWIEEKEDTLIDVSQADEITQGALRLAGIDLATGAILASEVGPDFAQSLKDKKLPTRPTTKRRALWAKMAGHEVLERGKLAGRYLQVVRVVGGEIELDGQIIYEGVIRHAKDAQKVLNYAVSAEMEAIALTPKAPWIIAEGQVEGYEQQWQNANTTPQAYLPYKPTSVGNAAVPPPSRVMAEANIGAITTSRQMAGEDLNQVTGIYPTQFGAPAPEQSGRAILARQNQGQTTNFHFADNFAMAVRYTGRILVDLIPRFYSGPDILRILGEDGAQEMVPIGQPGQFRGEQLGAPGGPPIIELGAGRYDVAVSLGPSYLSRRQEAAAQTVELMKVNPNISPVIMDLVVANMDIPGGDQIVERLRKMLPPQIRPPDDSQPPPQVLAQQLQQSQQMIERLTQEVHQLSHLIETKAIENKAKEFDAKSRERIALINSETELVKTLATIKSDAAQKMLDRTHELISKRLELDGIDQPNETTPTSMGTQPGEINAR